MLAHGLREPSGPWNALHGAGDVGRAVEVPKGLDEGVDVRAARRRTGGREALPGKFLSRSPSASERQGRVVAAWVPAAAAVAPGSSEADRAGAVERVLHTLILG